MKNNFLFLTLMMIAGLIPASAGESESPTEKYDLSLVWIADKAMKKEPAYIFTVNNTVGFSTVNDLKKYVETIPKGSTLTWAPGCERMGDEPLLSSEKQLAQFKSFCESHGIKLVLIPSG